MINWQNIDWKKISIIAGFVLVVLVVAYLLYSLFFAPTETPTGEPTSEITGGGLPEPKQGEQPGAVEPATQSQGLIPERITAQIPTPSSAAVSSIAEGGITKVDDLDYTKTTAMTLDSSGNNLITYNPEEGKFYKLLPDGTKTTLSDRVYKNVEKVSFAPQKNEAILEFPDGSNVFYNFETDKQVTLPKNWTDFNFNEQGDKIAFKDMHELSDYRFLGVSSPDGSNLKYLEKIGDRENDFFVDWSPSNKIVSIFRNSGTAETSKIYFVGQYGENFKSVVINGYGFVPKWTPDGSKLLYSAYNNESDFKPVLHIVDADGSNNGENHQSLGLNTWADKCTFSDANTAYCAVPKNLTKGAGLARESANTTADYIYKIDLNSGAKSFVAQPELDHAIGQMTISADGTNLYFTDINTETVHSIRLK